ncbi:MAG: hypothetical protein J0I20_30820 [Chloroflexi bacterium]|nr:hypothetical protein [Chloroflexota bacterium]OJV94198.1 MAG: hypothetical protein BGO39_12095 [Chloroflexi bacterium 54-19]
MADNRPKLSTCPICGYTDTAEDADALNSAIEEHIRLSHNLDPATLGGTADAVKPVTAETANQVGGDYNTTAGVMPIVPVAANSGGTGAAPTAPQAATAAGILANDDRFTNPNTRNRDEHRNDEMDNFS